VKILGEKKTKAGKIAEFNGKFSNGFLMLAWDEAKKEQFCDFPFVDAVDRIILSFRRFHHENFSRNSAILPPINIPRASYKQRRLHKLFF
jgi:hypothetical protein